MTNPTLTQAFNESNAYYLALGPGRIEKCFRHLSQEEIWRSPSPTLVSPGNLVVHLCGNLTQYVLSALGGQPDRRERDSEFQDRLEWSGEELVARLQRVVDEACTVIGGLTESRLTERYRVQGFEMTGAAIVVHVTEHLSYHVGQIAWHTKALKGVDLGFFADRDLNAKNG